MTPILFSMGHAAMLAGAIWGGAMVAGLPAVAGSPSPVPDEKVVGDVPYAHPERFFQADGSPEYLVYYREDYEYMAEHFLRPASDPEIRRMHDVHLGEAVAAILWLWQSGAGEQYLHRGHDLFGILIDYAGDSRAAKPGKGGATDAAAGRGRGEKNAGEDPSDSEEQSDREGKNKPVSEDCFGFSAALKSAFILRQAGQFDAAWEARLRRFAKHGVSHLEGLFTSENSTDRGLDGNQDLGRMYGILLAKRLFPDMPEAVAAAAKVNEVFTRILQQGDLHVDSLNYFEVSFYYFIQIAHELRRESEIANSAGFKRMFANIRDAVSPNGYLPEFGSGYFSPNRYSCVPIFLEYAGALYHDPSFAGPARRYFGMLVKSGPKRESNLHGVIQRCGATAGIHLLPDFQPWRGPLPASETNSSMVTRRNARSGSDRTAFLIMRPAVTPGAPMLLMDLLSQGDHCQREFGASIAYYESDHVPLFYQYGRYVAGASRGNQVIFGPPGTELPDPQWRAGDWRTFCIPAERLTGADGRAVIEHLSFRTAVRDKGKDSVKKSGYVLDNLRLVGPAGTKPVCDLPAGDWRGNSHSIVAGRHPGSHAIRIMEDGPGCALRTFQPLQFDPKKYTGLLGDVTWFGKEEPMQFRPTDNNLSWLSVKETSLLAMLKDVRTERRGDDCFASLEFAEYGTFDSSLVRQIVLTKEGVLAVRDNILPGASADGLPAFTLWQMYSIDSETPSRFTSRGECVYPSCDRADSTVYRRGMSVYFSGPAGVAIGKQVVPDGRGRSYDSLQRDKNLRTAFARVLLSAGRPTYLTLLVVPHSPDANLGQLDAATATVQDPTHSVFRTAAGNGSVQVEMHKDGRWLVQRSK